MSVLDRSELEQSHLADLHAIASELGIEGYRRLGRDALIDAILAGDSGEDDDGDDGEEKPAEKPRARGRRLGLRRGRKEDGDDAPASEEKDDVLGESDG